MLWPCPLFNKILPSAQIHVESSSISLLTFTVKYPHTDTDTTSMHTCMQTHTQAHFFWDHIIHGTMKNLEIPSRYRYPHVVHRPLSPSVCCWFQICILRCLFDIPLDCVTDNSQFTRYHLPEKLPKRLNFSPSPSLLYSFIILSGNSLQCSCLETPRDRGTGRAAVHGVAQSWTRLTRLSPHACIGEENGTEEPGGLPSVGLHQVGPDWSVLTAAAVLIYRACYF